MAEPARALSPTPPATRPGDDWARPGANALGNAAESASDAVVVLLDEVRALRGLVATLVAGRARSSDRDRERIALGRDAVLSLGRAAELLPLADREARAWLREQGLVVELATSGRSKEVVHWGAVLDRLGPAPVEAAEPTRRKLRQRHGRLPRVDLG